VSSGTSSGPQDLDMPDAPPSSGSQQTLPETDPVQIQATFAAQEATALRWRSSTAAERRARLVRLRSAILDHRAALYLAFRDDFRKPPMEVDGTELIPTLDEIAHAVRELGHWMRPVRVRPTRLTLGNRAWLQYQPRGRCLIIAPWNYPLYLLLGPLVSALAAGNPVILKPSELAPRVAAVLARIVATTFERADVALFEGALPTAQALLALPFDHIFFTGSPAVGRQVMAAAAKHLGSVTLELGGKSPAIVDESADLQRAADTLLWGKFVNGGQTCVAPDHLYVHAAVRDRFVALCQQVLATRYGADAASQRSNPDLARIINRRHTERVAKLLQDALGRGARLLAGGDLDVSTHFLAPTLIDQVPADAAIMSEEIFGPVLPIIEYSDLDQVIARINAQPKPLALYLWSKDPGRIARVMQNTSSGGACINHCVLHVAHGNLPFGGVNNSGMGSAHGIFGFKAFSHERAVLRSGWLNTIPLFFPPYTPQRMAVVQLMLRWLRR
jgi:aldehyde dehydrogenase (NAD+)